MESQIKNEGGGYTHNIKTWRYKAVSLPQGSKVSERSPPRLQRLHVNEPLEGRHKRLQPLLQVVDVLLRARGRSQ